MQTMYKPTNSKAFYNDEYSWLDKRCQEAKLELWSSITILFGQEASATVWDEMYYATSDAETQVAQQVAYFIWVTICHLP